MLLKKRLTNTVRLLESCSFTNKPGIGQNYPQDSLQKTNTFHLHKKYLSYFKSQYYSIYTLLIKCMQDTLLYLVYINIVMGKWRNSKEKKMQ